jgi:hypothetical protein
MLKQESPNRPVSDATEISNSDGGGGGETSSKSPTRTKSITFTHDPKGIQKEKEWSTRCGEMALRSNGYDWWERNPGRFCCTRSYFPQRPTIGSSALNWDKDRWRRQDQSQGFSCPWFSRWNCCPTKPSSLAVPSVSYCWEEELLRHSKQGASSFWTASLWAVALCFAISLWWCDCFLPTRSQPWMCDMLDDSQTRNVANQTRGGFGYVSHNKYRHANLWWHPTRRPNPDPLVFGQVG